eukprot:gene8282-9850_t
MRKTSWSLRRPPPHENPHSNTVNWLIQRKVKVASLELHEHCGDDELSSYLQRFGEHIRHIISNEDCNRSYAERDAPSQNSLIAKYCHSLTAYRTYTSNSYDGSILRIINNNSRLETLSFDGDLSGKNYPVYHPLSALPHLRQLKWVVRYGFGDSLLALANAAPNLQQLSICCNPYKCTEIAGKLVLDVARACSNLRTFYCNELHIGDNDSFLRSFLAICNNINNLDLNRHYELTDYILIEALSELTTLHCLNLQGCSRLTDRTLEFLPQRFASSLRVLYLDQSAYPEFVFYDEEDAEGNPVVHEAVTGGYTAAGIASLRAQCNQLHTYHYAIEAGTATVPQNFDVYQNATIVHVRSNCDDVVSAIVKHCQQMEILAFTSARMSGERVWLSVDQLMTIAAKCPQLRMVVNEPCMFSSDENEVDYDWVDALSVIKLDFALDRDESLHLTVADILQTGHFHLKKVKRIRNWTDWTNPSPPTNVNTKVLNWLILRQVKVLDLALHELSCKAVLGTYLAKFGEHVRHIYPCEDCERFGETYQSQNALIAKHCHNQIGYTVCSYGTCTNHIISVLANNVHLQDLYIYGGLRDRNNLAKDCGFTLPNLTQLKWGDKYGLDYDLVALVEAAPNLQKVAIFSERSSTLDGEVALDLARACSQ